MLRYFFHTADGATDIDEHGTEFPDLAAARVGAIRYAGDVLSDDPDVMWDGRDFRVQVADEAGKVLVTIVTLAIDAVAIKAAAEA